MHELKEWRTANAQRTMATVLMLDGISFSYDAEMGEIFFTAPEWYVDSLGDRLVNSFGAKRKPIINEVKA